MVFGRHPMECPSINFIFFLFFFLSRKKKAYDIRIKYHVMTEVTHTWTGREHNEPKKSLQHYQFFFSFIEVHYKSRFLYPLNPEISKLKTYSPSPIFILFCNFQVQLSEYRPTLLCIPPRSEGAHQLMFTQWFFSYSEDKTPCQ